MRPVAADGMRPIELAYGKTGLLIELTADRTTVVAPVHHPAVPDEAATLRHALRNPIAGPPLRAIVRPGQQVAVSICDVTRPQPREAMIRTLLAELDGIVRPDDITLLVATGTRREPGPAGGRPAALYRFASPRLEITDPFAVLRPPSAG